MHKLRKDLELSGLRKEADARSNRETRLPEDESVQLGGVTLVEAFTPSTVFRLKKTLRKWPRQPERFNETLAADLERGRSTTAAGGWKNLGTVRRPGQFIMGDGHHDDSLPSGVEAVWLSLRYLMPSVALVCATFTFADDVADLSDLLRTDFETETEKTRIVVHGSFGRLRALIPWSRPKRFSTSAPVWTADGAKQRAVERRIRQREAECARWFFAKFEGRFAEADPKARPSIRLIFTEKALPFSEGRRTWLEPAGLAWTPFVYRCTDVPGWALKTSPWPTKDDRYAWTVAARRSDVGREGASDATGRSNWSLAQRFKMTQESLAAGYALAALLDIYADRLAILRDAAGGRHPGHRPVRDARNLDRYLLTDGLDAATITADIAALTEDLTRYRRNMPEYTEDQGDRHKEGNKPQPRELVPSLCESLRGRAARLAADTANTDGNLRASAELRQAIANTRLQRVVVGFTIFAVVVAVLSVVVAVLGLINSNTWPW